MRDVQEPGVRRIRRRLPVLATRGVRADVVHDLADLRFLVSRA